MVSAIASSVEEILSLVDITSSPHESPKKAILPEPNLIFQVRTFIPPPSYGASEASEIFVPVPEGGHHGHEWSIESPGVALFVDDEDRYSYVKQYENDWKIVNLQDIEEI